MRMSSSRATTSQHTTPGLPGGGLDVPPAWRVAFDAARDRAVSANGNLLLGINAHVQRDLPFVLYSVGLVRPDGGSRKPDHDRVNRILNRVTDDIIAEVARRFDPSIEDTNAPTTLDDFVLFQSIVSWREMAWRNAELLALGADPGGARAGCPADREQCRSAGTRDPGDDRVSPARGRQSRARRLLRDSLVGLAGLVAVELDQALVADPEVVRQLVQHDSPDLGRKRAGSPP